MTHPMTTSKRAAEIILDHVALDKWRILVGEDVVKIDEVVRQIMRWSKKLTKNALLSS